MNGVGIVSALAAEARPLGIRTRRGGQLSALPDGTLLAITGVGPQAAESGALALVGAGATALASWGLAGGLDPALAPGTLLLPAEIVAPDGTALPTAPRWRARLAAAVAGHCPVAGGRLLSSPQAIQSVADKAAAFRLTGAGAVDMESLAIARIAIAHGLPFVAIRVVVDAATDAVPRTVIAALGGTGRLRIGRLLVALLAAPADLAALVRLARRFRVAQRSLAAVARHGAPAANAFRAA